jgi:outer membrane protein TolC
VKAGRCATARVRLLLALLLSCGSISEASADEGPELDRFLHAARTRDAGVLARRADEVAAAREHEAAWLGLAPRFSAVAAYTRNEVEVGITLPTEAGSETIVTTPRDQLDLTLKAEIDLVDVPGWSRIAATSDAQRAAHARTQDGERVLEEGVVRAYFDLLGAQSLESAARRGVEVGRASLDVARGRRAAGVGSELDERRAERDLAERVRLVVQAGDERTRAARRLERASGLSADRLAGRIAVELREPPAVGELTGEAARRPDVVAARIDAERASADRTGTWAALAPRVSGSFSERFTNAAGFGVSPAWAAGVSATWTLDPAAVGDGRARDATARAAELRARVAVEDAVDEIRDRHADVVLRRAALLAATEERVAAEAAADVARARDAAGTSTVLDRLLAERDELTAQVEEARAQARLASARALLELAVGR